MKHLGNFEFSGISDAAENRISVAAAEQFMC